MAMAATQRTAGKLLSAVCVSKKIFVSSRTHATLRAFAGHRFRPFQLGRRMIRELRIRIGASRAARLKRVNLFRNGSRNRRPVVANHQFNEFMVRIQQPETISSKRWGDRLGTVADTDPPREVHVAIITDHVTSGPHAIE